MAGIMIGIDWKKFFEQWKDVEIYNPHCSKWKQCELRKNEDCFHCEDNLQGTDEYIFEKLIPKMENEKAIKKNNNGKYSIQYYTRKFVKEVE